MKHRYAIYLAAVLVGSGLSVAACGGSQHDAKTGGHPQAAPEELQNWEKSHVEASKDLGDWVKSNPTAAAKFFEWDSKHPEKLQELVTWADTNPNDTFDSFLAAHKDWHHLDAIVEHHKAAAEGLIAWVRKHTTASRDLFRHSQALDWVGHHIYSSYWSMERPNEQASPASSAK
jgi:hypothetical protein